MFPFLFFNHGKALDLYSFQGQKEGMIWFKNEVAEKDRTKIEKLCPKPLKQTLKWGRKQLYNSSVSDEDEIFGYYIRKIQKRASGSEGDYEKFSEQAIAEFAHEIEQWAVQTNEIAPILFFIGVERITGSKWDKWSRENIQMIEKELETFAASGVTPTEKMIIENAIERLKSLPGSKFKKKIKISIKKSTDTKSHSADKVTSKNVVEVNKKNIEEVISASPIALLAFLSGWDPGSKTIEPVLDEVVSMTGGKFSIGKLFVEEHSDLFEDYDVEGMPELLIFKNGKKVGTVNDDDPQVIIKALESYI